MSIATAKAAALEALLDGPFKPDPMDPRIPAIQLLKRDGIPVVSRNTGRGVMVHELIATDLQPHEVKARRGEGLTMGLHWHRREPVAAWPELIAAIPCPFARDEAGEYLRTIMQRMNIARSYAAH